MATIARMERMSSLTTEAIQTVIPITTTQPRETLIPIQGKGVTRIQVYLVTVIRAAEAIIRAALACLIVQTGQVYWTQISNYFRR